MVEQRNATQRNATFTSFTNLEAFPWHCVRQLWHSTGLPPVPHPTLSTSLNELSSSVWASGHQTVTRSGSVSWFVYLCTVTHACPLAALASAIGGDGIRPSRQDSSSRRVLHRPTPTQSTGSHQSIHPSRVPHDASRQKASVCSHQSSLATDQ